ncbi:MULTISPECIES: hypothetical protein [unclassified Geodermatophilus]|uniref:hypothetical protein n=1 Tax=unclassified Geodermatophilus TaxID=2637632 RepID=UPI003EEB25D5
MTTPALAQVPVRSAAELTRRWVEVLDPPVFAARSLWLLWLGEDSRMLPVVVPVDDVPPVPDLPTLHGLRDLHGTVTEHCAGPAHLAMALCRPGHGAVTARDDEWAEGLEAVLDGIDGTWSLHLAAGGRVVPLVDAPGATWRR